MLKMNRVKHAYYTQNNMQNFKTDLTVNE